MTQPPRLDFFAALNRIQQLCHEPKLSFEKKLQDILDIIVEVMNTRIGSIMLIKGRKSLQVAASTNPALIGYKQPLREDTHSSWVVRHKTPLYSRNQLDRSFYRNNSERYKKEAFYIVPIRKGNDIIGVINVTEKKDADHYTQKERECLLTLAGSLIGAIENNRLNQRLTLKKQQLREKSVRLEKLEQIQAELFHLLIHDLKNPLAEVIANLDIISYKAHDELSSFITPAQTSCQAITSMITDFLDIARIESGRIEIIPETLRPMDLLMESTARLDALIRMKQIAISIQPDPGDANMSFRSDRSLLLRILKDLLINAIYFSPLGAMIRLGFNRTENGGLRLYVKDAGPGIPPEYQESIFDKYFKIIHKEYTGRYASGLGLTFCKLAVERLGGAITVESDGKNGSCFRVDL